MKRFVWFFIVVLFLSACDPDKWRNYHYAAWYTKNTTSAPVRITTLDITDSIVYPGDSIKIERFRLFQFEGIPLFSLLYDCPGKMDEDQVRRIDILSVDGRLLRTWKSSERHLPGRQFFNESYWLLYEERDNNDPEIKRTWIFDILPEDIVPAKPEP